MKLLSIQRLLENAGLAVFTTEEFRRLSGQTLAGARKFLVRYTRIGVFWQLRRGYYAVRGNGMPLWLMANKLYRPSYVSLETALSHYGVIPESVYGVTSVTTRITREFEACGNVFSYHTIKTGAYTGYVPMLHEGHTVLVADLEKALADYLYFVHFGAKQLNERIYWKMVNRKMLRHYLGVFARKNLLAWSRDVIPHGN